MIDETACTPFALHAPCPRCSACAHEPCAEVEQPPLVGLVQVHVERWRAFDAWASAPAEAAP
jgi:hypothetical protein